VTPAATNQITAISEAHTAWSSITPRSSYRFGAELLLDRGEALKHVINLFPEPGDILELLRKIIQLIPEGARLCF
jgi:hypothetical protein